MLEVTIVGLGKMGTALAEALLRGSASVTVWNRNAARAEQLVVRGAKLGSTLASAIEASDVVIVSLSGYAAALGVLAAPDVAPSLRGRTLIQLSSGTPKEAREAATWASQLGASYLDGAILAYPMHIGTDRAQILASGPRALFDAHEALLRQLGSPQFVGESPGAASALDCAALGGSMLNIVGLLYGISVCEAEQVDPQQLVSMLNARLAGRADLHRALAESARTRSYGNPQASLETWAAVVDHLAEISNDRRLSGTVPSFLNGLFEEARARGLAQCDIASLVEVMRSLRAE
jgi:3-hydroxyisobutyrate dehydrogenase-like beta-hydroxyacid dehydrogenase